MEWLQETLNICAQLHELMVNVILFTALHNDVSEADDDSTIVPEIETANETGEELRDKDPHLQHSHSC